MVLNPLRQQQPNKSRRSQKMGHRGFHKEGTCTGQGGRKGGQS